MAKRTVNKKNLSEAYVERDLSWMYFNRRILQEATKQQIPLLERLGYGRQNGTHHGGASGYQRA